MAVALNGLDSIIFTGGIGEHQPEIRAAILEQLRWLGFNIDYKANDANALQITTQDSRLAAYVIATDEEQCIADDAAYLMKH